ncbi:MAG: hypothetical protein GAK43_01799 [Stenotrophomonas maltophilia]|nr:MAG: hypothetical protein GAK43_01799 [Stenotrophomonas maltophilia]
MNSKVLMVFAGLLLLGALVVGYLGLSIGKPTPPPSPAGSESASAELSEVDKLQRTAVVVVTRDLPPLSVLGKDDLRIEYLHTAPSGSFTQIEPLLGQRVWVAAPAGSILSGALLEPGGPLARTIRPNERAIAIPVDEVVGGGGFVSPGDYVDVLLFVQDQQPTSRSISAQIVVPGVRVLTYGEQIAVAQDGQSRTDAPDPAQKMAQKPIARTAVLAVPAESAARLMLASQAGALRLAVRSHDEKLYDKAEQGQASSVAQGPGSNQLITLDQLLGGVRRTPVEAATLPTMAAPRPAAEPGEGSGGVAVYRGSKLTRESP